tara:strand:+ start:232 stop:486 length:255 start_codon:yes stop_codon:yes gene_type:complete
MGKSPFTMPGSQFLGKGNQSVSPGKYTASPAKHPHTKKKGAKRDEKVAHGIYGHNTQDGLSVEQGGKDYGFLGAPKKEESKEEK